MKRPLAIVVVTVCSGLLLVSLAFNVGHWLSAPGAAPIQGDLIVALGGSSGSERVGRALELYRNGYARGILLTGIDQTDGIERSDRYRHWVAKFLIDGGVPSEALLFDDLSKNSYEEAHNTALLMQHRRWRTALVVSDPPHLRRLAMVWGRACDQNGLEYRLIATEPHTWNASRWWREKVWAKFVGMELLKLTYYSVVYEIPELIRIMG